MEAITGAMSRAANYLGSMGISDFVDIIIVAYLIYKGLWFIRKTNFYNLAKGLLLVLVSLWLSGVLQLTMINFLLRNSVEMGLIAVLILFQPELRRVLERMGSRITTGHTTSGTYMARAISQIVNASRDMSASRTGALMAFERNVSLDSSISTGTVINADATAELIKNIFYNKAPLHDGAVIVRDGKLAAAGCVLPLTQSLNLSAELGMRHRAGLGLSEQSDAVVLIISEETGSISVAIDGMLKRHLTTKALEQLLKAELVHDENKEEKQGVIANLRKLLKIMDNANEKHDEKTV